MKHPSPADLYFFNYFGIFRILVYFGKNEIMFRWSRNRKDLVWISAEMDLFENVLIGSFAKSLYEDFWWLKFGGRMSWDFREKIKVMRRLENNLNCFFNVFFGDVVIVMI